MSFYKFYQIYFTQFPYVLFHKATQVGNMGYAGVGLGLIHSQQMFWVSNSCVGIVVYNNMYNVNYFYTNCGLSILSFILYILSFNKAINLLVLLR
uniref:Uncharacterized protein n=1 Tax=viral metagenome TaxID=1070528 RepID=A0A6C0HYJ3_9ZZZZ